MDRDEEIFNQHQELYLDNKFVEKTTFYDYQKIQDDKIANHEKEFTRVLLSLKIIAIITTGIAFPMIMMLLNLLITELRE
ncbi:MAG: hypothetical protein ACRCZK_01750 [Oscillospiraceae bacterium]